MFQIHAYEVSALQEISFEGSKTEIRTKWPCHIAILLKTRLLPDMDPNHVCELDKILETHNLLILQSR